MAAAFAVCALALRDPLQDQLLSGNEALYWILVAAVLAFGASFFARGFLAGSRRFTLYAILLLAESTARVSFALAVAVGIASGQTAVALGIVAAPLVSLTVVPLAFAGRALSEPRRAVAVCAGIGHSEFTLAAGGGFAAAVLVIMISEQSLLNAGPLLVKASEGAAAAGFIFNVLMVARAPLVLFQAVATSLLPHLTRLRSSADAGDAEAFRLSVRLTIGAIAVFAAAVGLIVFVAGPQLMQLAFGKKFGYDRVGLLIVTVGMGFYLSSGTLNQAALAQGQVRRAAVCWAGCALAFLGWNLLPVLDEFRRVEVGFAGAAALLCGLLYLLYRSPRRAQRMSSRPARQRSSRRGWPPPTRRVEAVESNSAESLGYGYVFGGFGLRRGGRPSRIYRDFVASPRLPRTSRAAARFAGRPRRARDRGTPQIRRRTGSLPPRRRRPTVSASMPPSTSIIAAGARPRSLETLSGEEAMKGCPPQPGLTDMQRIRSADAVSSTTDSAGVPGLSARPARQPASRIAPRVRWA